jgi:hypothetical protein
MRRGARPMAIDPADYEMEKHITRAVTFFRLPLYLAKSEAGPGDA